MASTFPLAPANGAVHYVSGTSYTYDSAIGWVRTPPAAAGYPADGATFTSSLAQFTQPIFGQNQVYENIFDAYVANTGVFQRHATSPLAWDVTTYAGGWYGIPMLRATPAADSTKTNIQITVPAWARIVWIRVICDDVTIARENNLICRWNSTASTANNGQWDTHTWNDNHSYPLRMGPYGHPLYDHNGNTASQHIWHPIFVPAGGGTLFIMNTTLNSYPDGWISGLAFTDNPQGWTCINAISMHRQGVGGFPQTFSLSNGLVAPPMIAWAGDNWGLTRVSVPGTNGTTVAGSQGFWFPIVNNGKDKRMTFVMDDDNDDWGGVTDFSIRIGGQVYTGVHQHTCLDWFSVAVLNNQNQFRPVSIDIPAAVIAAAAVTVNATVSHAEIRLWRDRTFYNSQQIAMVHAYDI